MQHQQRQCHCQCQCQCHCQQHQPRRPPPAAAPRTAGCWASAAAPASACATSATWEPTARRWTSRRRRRTRACASATARTGAARSCATPARPTCGTCTAATSPTAVWTFGSPARGSSTRRRAGPPRGRTDRRARLRCRRRRTTHKRCGRPMGSTCCWTATPGPMRAARVGSTTVRAP